MGWIVAASIATVETMTDQGICRWNHAIESLQNDALQNFRIFAKPQNFSFTSSSSNYSLSNINISEKSIDKIMHLGCLGPNTVRFSLYTCI